MTKKDYELIASAFEILTNNVDIDELTQLESIELVARRLCDKLAEKNPRFDKEKFLKACGVEVEEDKTYCHLCGGEEKNHYCKNTTCGEYTRY